MASDSDSRAERRRATGRRTRGPRGGVLGEWLRSLFYAFLLFLLIRTFIAESYYISSGSMEETLLVGDVLMVSKAAYGATIPGTATRLPGYSEPTRGDLVIFRPEHDPETDVVKRLVGMPGDTLEMRDRALYLNGELYPEPYVRHEDEAANETHPWMVWQYDHLVNGPDPDTYTPSRDDWGPIRVPEGRYFLMGDSRESSLDSRYYGFVGRDRIRGRVAFLYYSFDPTSVRPLPLLFAARPGRIGERP